MKLALMAGKCIYNDRKGPSCANLPLLLNRPHGWLCKDHAANEDGVWRSQRMAKNFVRDLDMEVVWSIIVNETKAIMAGTVQTTRFGALEPTYFKTWTA